MEDKTVLERLKEAWANTSPEEKERILAKYRDETRYPVTEDDKLVMEYFRSRWESVIWKRN